MEKATKSLFIFRRDLRLQDNTGLIEALKNSNKVICCFIFDPRQLNSPYKSNNALQFMCDSLEELNKELEKKKSRLFIFEGKAEEVIEKLIKKENIQAVYFNKDYTPFSTKRDYKIKRVCEKNKIECNSFDDCLLTKPGSILTLNRTPYTIYSAFFKKAKLEKINKPLQNKYTNYYKKKVAIAKPKTFIKKIKPKENKKCVQKGGRSNAIKILKTIERFKGYHKERDIPSRNGTTKLSAHNKFGTVSIREVYWKVAQAFDKHHTVIAELFWRDFFTHIIFHFPYILGKSFRKKYEKLSWQNDKRKFAAWCNGKTGFPIVDAGMRELNETGFMHNRVRMITASFLIKDLHIDWRWGEKYFAQKLVDYDPAVNNGNWQWAASTGCDAQPYFRIFNPWRQQERFDPDCVYIKKWIPELKRIPPKEIHKWQGSKNYPTPMLDHKEESKKAKMVYSLIK